MYESIKISSRERIKRTACDLFFNQGYHQTGINQIIEEAGVAKATFYSHFKSKEELCLEYLRDWAADSTSVIKDMVNSIDDPYEKYLSVMNAVVKHMEDSNFRGCAFGNIASEIVDGNHPIRKEVKYHEEIFRSIIRDAVENLKKSGKKYKNIDVDYVSNVYYLIVEGSITASQNYHDSWPMKYAVKAVEDLIKK